MKYEPDGGKLYKEEWLSIKSHSQVLIIANMVRSDAHIIQVNTSLIQSNQKVLFRSTCYFSTKL